MIRQFRVFRRAGMSVSRSVSLTYQGAMIDLYFLKQKIKRKLKNLRGFK